MDHKSSFASFFLALVVCGTTTNTVVSFQPVPKPQPTVTSYGNYHDFGCPNCRQDGIVGGVSSLITPSPSSTRRFFLSNDNTESKSSTKTKADAAAVATSPRTLGLDSESKFLSLRIKHDDITSDEEYQRRKQEWALRYTSVEALRETFGTNKNKLWGDLHAGTARRLYKTLLPRALLELSKVGALKPEDLAPLAYEARVAAKKYARERSTVPLRLAATLYDGFRQWRTYGKFQAHGLTYEQIWEKYEKAIISEAKHIASSANGEDKDFCVQAKVSQLILERSCKTNDKVDSFALKGIPHDTQKELLEQIHAQLQRDVYQLLLPSEGDISWLPEVITNRSGIRNFKTLRLIAMAKQKILNKKRQKNRTARKEQQKQQQQQQPCLQEVTISSGQQQQQQKPWNDRQSQTKLYDREEVWINRPETWLNRQ
jgi:hypothetical protein